MRIEFPGQNVYQDNLKKPQMKKFKSALLSIYPLGVTK